MHKMTKYFKELSKHKKRILCNSLSPKLVDRLSSVDCDFFIFTSEEKDQVVLGKNVFALPVNDMFPMLSYDAILAEYNNVEDVRIFRQMQQGFEVPMLSIFDFPFSTQDIQARNLQNVFGVMAGTISIVPDAGSVEAIESLGMRAIDYSVYDTNILEQILLKEGKNETSN